MVVFSLSLGGCSFFNGLSAKKQDMIQIAESKKMKVAIEEYLKNLDPEALTPNGKIKTYRIIKDKLKYNPNVDQAIKGDDTLMVDLFEENGNEKIKIYLGESKFRTTPQKNVVEDITKSLNKDTLPLSYTFLVEEIAKSDELLARKLDDYIVQDIKDRGDLIYVGLLLSNTKTSETVEKHLNSDNSNLVFISIGIGQPEEFIKSIFEKAEELISNPDLL